MFYKGPLPFARGETMLNGDTAPATDCYESLVGRIYECEDTNTSEPIQLLVVRNDTGSTLTGAKKFYRFDTGQYAFGRNVAGLANTAGMICKPMDPKLNGVSIVNDDLFYLVYSGPAEATTETTAITGTVHQQIRTDNLGRIDGTAPAAGNFVIGTLDQAVCEINTAARIHVSPGWSGGEGT